MRIQHPDWYDFEGDNQKICPVKLAKWFEENVDPVNKMLAEGVEVYGGTSEHPLDGVEYWSRKFEGSHKALLVKIQPIKKETAEDVLRDIMTSGMWLERSLAERAKKVLGEK